LFISASYDDFKEKAIQPIRFWRGAMIKAFDVDVHNPRQIEDNGQVIGDDTLEKMLLITTNTEEGVRKLKICGFRLYRNCSDQFRSSKG
jgi:coenzyme F420-dependent glucose-6-phosphate dehydrogenase